MPKKIQKAKICQNVSQANADAGKKGQIKLTFFCLNVLYCNDLIACQVPIQ